MKAADPSIQLTAAAANSKQWMLPLLKMAGEHLSYISIHNYWLPLWQKNEMPDYLTCIMLSDGPEKAIADCIGVLEESGLRGRIKIAYDEWNLRGWHHPGFPEKRCRTMPTPRSPNWSRPGRRPTSRRNTRWPTRCFPPLSSMPAFVTRTMWGWPTSPRS